MECLLDEIIKIVSGEYASSEVTKSYSGYMLETSMKGSSWSQIVDATMYESLCISMSGINRHKLSFKRKVTKAQ